MISKDKITKIFCIADNFCIFYTLIGKCAIKSKLKRKNHRESNKSKAEIIVIIMTVVF